MNCSRCGSTLEPTPYGPASWRCCPTCEPQMFPALVPAGHTVIPTISEEARARSLRLSDRPTETE